jgi:hypothetical protein
MRQLRKVFLVSILLSGLNAFGDEGMWLPILLKQLNESDMKANGLKLNAEDIYSLNKTSLKDAVVLFGGGCTGEIISDQGLLLTNHHCGYSSINAHSSVKNNYLQKGYWAKDHSEELSNPGLTATFIIRMEDVSAKVNAVLSDSMNEATRNIRISAISKKLKMEAEAGTHYEAYVKPFYNGSEFYLFVTEVFKDVRLVGAPPESIGKFGGETDNWVWPRHNADFCLFRIYANKNNEPAEYSKENVPYKPRYHIPISLKGEEENDFTMVYGFPGRTSEYLTSFAVDMIQHESDPVKIELREKRLEVIKDEMAKSDSLRLRYATKFAGISNGYKKMMGEVNGLEKYDAVTLKKKEEEQFMKRLDAMPAAKGKYRYLLGDIQKAYSVFRPLNKARDLFTEGIMSVELLNHYFEYYKLVTLVKQAKGKKEEYKMALENLRKASGTFIKYFPREADKKTFISMMKIYMQEIDPALAPLILKEVSEKYKGSITLYAEKIYKNPFVLDARKTAKLFDNVEKGISKLEKDDGFRLVKALYENYEEKVKVPVNKAESEVNALNKRYLDALREVMSERKFYPDANSTLRVSYGKVKDYFPKDGTRYDYFSTLQGVMQKEKAGDPEFTVAPRLKELYNQKDFGRYADKDGQMHVAFIATNHTTGGNSGSPVFNGKGQLIGTNFDRNWEGTMSDIMYDPSQVRNIALDIRYTLFIIDKFAGARYLVDEMTIEE